MLSVDLEVSLSIKTGYDMMSELIDSGVEGDVHKRFEEIKIFDTNQKHYTSDFRSVTECAFSLRIHLSC